MASNLVLTADVVASPSVINSAASLLSCSAQQLSLATQSGTVGNDAPGSTPLPSSAFSGAVSFGPAGHHTAALLGAICKALKPGAKLVVQEMPGATAAAETSLKSNLLLAGLTSPEVSSDGTTLKASASKPSWETGAKAAIALKPRTAAAATPAAAAPAAAAAWKLSAADEDEELIDEDELLTEEDLQRPAVPAGGLDCSVSKKACKNCSCGRAEAEAAGMKAELTPEMLNNPQSACGSCGLGDAFRCSSCPYKGLPPFQPGAKIQLASDLLTADV